MVYSGESLAQIWYRQVNRWCKYGIELVQIWYLILELALVRYTSKIVGLNEFLELVLLCYGLALVLICLPLDSSQVCE